MYSWLRSTVSTVGSTSSPLEGMSSRRSASAGALDVLGRCGEKESEGPSASSTPFRRMGRYYQASIASR